LIDLIIETNVSGQDYKPVFYEGKNSRYLKIKVSDVQPEKSKLAIGELELYGF
jgi:beta-galactosidase